MSLARPTNSLQSNIMHASVKGMPDPTVGMGVTVLHYTDRTVGTIVEVISPDHVVFTDDKVTADTSKGEVQMGHQDWIYTPQPDAARTHAMRHKNGRWYLASLDVRGKLRINLKCTPCARGRKDYHYDWSF